MNELQVAIGRSGLNLGYQRVMAAPGMGDFSHFLPGAGTSMGYDDLKLIECRKFIEAYLGGPAKNCNIQDAVASARVLSAAEESAASRQWVSVPATDGTTAALR